MLRMISKAFTVQNSNGNSNAAIQNVIFFQRPFKDSPVLSPCLGTFKPISE